MTDRSDADPDEALSNHVVFFDVDADGTITRAEIQQALRQLGFSPPVSGVLAPLLAVALPSEVEQILQVRHDDTGSFTADGRFDAEAFERWWLQTDRDGDGLLTRWELLRGSLALADDPRSLIASIGELQLVHGLLAGDGGLAREAIEHFLDGQLFATLVAQREIDGS